VRSWAARQLERLRWAPRVSAFWLTAATSAANSYCWQYVHRILQDEFLQDVLFEGGRATLSELSDSFCCMRRLDTNI